MPDVVCCFTDGTSPEEMTDMKVTFHVDADFSCSKKELKKLLKAARKMRKSEAKAAKAAKSKD